MSIVDNTNAIGVYVTGLITVKCMDRDLIRLYVGND